MLRNREFEDYLLMRVKENDDSRTKDAMAYSLMNGGKRVRPILLFSVLEGYGMDARVGYPCACAIEMIHTYSLASLAVIRLMMKQQLFLQGMVY